MTQVIRILLVDDHALFRAGLARLLGDYHDLVVAGEAGTADEATECAERLQPEVILMDIDMPDEDGVSATRRIKQALPDARIIMLTMYARDSYVLEAIRAGAYGYLLKDASAEELVGTIRMVAQGGAVIKPQLARRMLDEFTRHAAGGETTPKGHGHDALSTREAQVLALIAAGETSRTIAQQ